MQQHEYAGIYEMDCFDNGVPKGQHEDTNRQDAANHRVDLRLSAQVERR